MMGVLVAGAMALGAGAPASAGPLEPNVARTPEEVKAAVAQLAVASNKRVKVNDLRRSCPAPLLAEALVNAMASDPGFKAGPTRVAAYEGLASVGTPGADGAILVTDRQVDQLVLGLKESDEQIRRMSAGALGRVPEHRRASVSEPLTAVLDDTSSVVVQQALLSLAKLKLHKDVPAGVRAIAFDPTDAMRARWRGGSGGPQGTAQEINLREAAMNVVLSWQGADALLDRDLSKDEAGRTARAIAVGRKVLKESGRSDLDERQHQQLIGELVELLKQPGELRDADRGAAMVLSTLARKGSGDSVKTMAKEALKQASETAPASKQGVIAEGLAGLR